MGKLSQIKDKLIIYSYYLAVAIILFAVIADMAESKVSLTKSRAYYALDSNASDLSSNAKHGSVIGTPVIPGTCKVGTCYSGFSDTKYIDTPLTNNYIQADRDFDLTFWGRTGNVASGFINGVTDTTNNQVRVGISNYVGGDVRVSLIANTFGCNFYTQSACFGDSNWHFVWIHKDSVCSKSFIYCDTTNMTLTFSATTSADATDNVDHYFIGARSNDGTPANGANHTLDEYAFWDGLNLTDYTYLRNSGAGINPYYDNPAPPITPTMAISSTFPNNLNVTNSSLRFYFNGSVSNTRANNVNCTFRLNSTINQTKSVITITNLLNFSISTIGWNKGYVANITCRNNNASASLKRTFWIYQPYVPPEEEPETNTTGSYAELIAVNNQIYEVLALIPFVLLWLGLWALGYYALQTNNTLLAGTMIILTLPLDFFFSYRFQETLMLGTGFLGIAFAVMTAWTIGIFILLKRPVRG